MKWDYKLQPDSDRVAKFQGDRSRDLGESVAKQKTSPVKHKPSGTTVPGGLIITLLRVQRREFLLLIYAACESLKGLYYKVQ